MAIDQVNPLTRIEKGSALSYLEMDTNFTGAAAAINALIDLQVPNLKALADVTPKDGVTYHIQEFNTNTGIGAFNLKWDATRAWTSADIGLVYPNVALNAWNGTAVGIATLYGSHGSGVGCWVRVNITEKVDLVSFGFTGNEFNTIIPFVITSGAEVIISSIPVNVVTQTPTLSNIELHGIDFTGSSIVRHADDVLFYNCSFSGGVRGRPNYDSENSSYLLCNFSGNSYIDCESGFNRGPRFLSVSLCKTIASPLIFGTTLNDSVIATNQVDATGGAFAISYAGSGNKITQNDVKGGVAGIIGIPLRSTNQTQNISDNVVAFNTVYDQTEESISLDCRGNSTTDGLVVTEAQVTAQTANSISIDVALPAFSGINQYVIFHTGSKAGQYFKIVFRGSDGLGSYQLENYIGSASDVGQTITISLGCFNNSIFNNTVRNSGITGIMIWGGYVATSIDANDVFNCPITIETLSGIASLYRVSRQPTHNTTLTRNAVKNANINITEEIYNSSPIINPVGITAKDNPSDVVNTLSCVMQDMSGNNSYTGTNVSVTKDNNEIVVKIPKITLVNSVVTTIYEFELPSNFSVVVDATCQIQLPQCVGSRTATVIGYRSNETVSLYGSSVTQGSLNVLEAQPAARNIDNMDLTATLLSSATINSTATLQIKFAATLSGGAITGSTVYQMAAELKLRVVS